MRWTAVGVVALVMLAACAPEPTEVEQSPQSSAVVETPTARQSPTGAAPSATPATASPTANQTMPGPQETGEDPTPAMPPPFEEEEPVEDMPPVTAGTGPVRTQPPPRPQEVEPATEPMTTPPRVGARELARMTIADVDGFPNVVHQTQETQAGGVLRVEAQCQSPQPAIQVLVRRGATEVGTVEVPCHFEQGMRSSTTLGSASDAGGPVSLELVPDPQSDAPLASGTSAWVRVLRG